MANPARLRPFEVCTFPWFTATQAFILPKHLEPDRIVRHGAAVLATNARRNLWVVEVGPAFRCTLFAIGRSSLEGTVFIWMFET